MRSRHSKNSPPKAPKRNCKKRRKARCKDSPNRRSKSVVCRTLFMECGDVTPLLFLFLFLWHAASTKRNRGKSKKRNKSGAITPHSIKVQAASKPRSQRDCRGPKTQEKATETAPNKAAARGSKTGMGVESGVCLQTGAGTCPV